MHEMYVVHILTFGEIDSPESKVLQLGNNAYRINGPEEKMETRILHQKGLLHLYGPSLARIHKGWFLVETYCPMQRTRTGMSAKQVTSRSGSCIDFENDTCRYG